MARGEGLRELKRLFGDVIEVTDEHYLIHFPKRLEETEDFGDSEYEHGFMPSKEYNPHASDDDDDGPMLRPRKRRDFNLPPSQQAYNELRALRIASTSEMKQYDTADGDVLSISKYAAELPLFIIGLKNIPDDDDRFRRLTQRGYDDDAPDYNDAHHHDDDGEKPKKSPATRVIEKLNELNKKVKWEVDELPLEAGGKKELVVATTKPVANAFGALFLITEALEIPAADIPKPVGGRAVLPIKLLVDHEEMIDNLAKLDPKRFTALLTPATTGGPGGPGSK